MKQSGMILKSVASGLTAMADSIEIMAEELSEVHESYDKTAEKLSEKAAKNPKKTAPKKVAGKKKAAPKKKKNGKPVSDTDAVFNLIEISGKGIDLESLCMLTGFDKSKITNIAHRLKKQGKIKSEKKGFYSKV